MVVPLNAPLAASNDSPIATRSSSVFALPESIAHVIGLYWTSFVAYLPSEAFSFVALETAIFEPEA